MYRTPYSDTLEETRASESESSPHWTSATLCSREHAGTWVVCSGFCSPQLRDLHGRRDVGLTFGNEDLLWAMLVLRRRLEF